jgi:hypothetical protein
MLILMKILKRSEMRMKIPDPHGYQPSIQLLVLPVSKLELCTRMKPSRSRRISQLHSMNHLISQKDAEQRENSKFL